LFLELVQARHALPGNDGPSSHLGAILVWLGVACLVGALQFRQFCKTLLPGSIPSSARPWRVWLTWALAVVGACVGVVLVA
jgi:hypothetical protein